MNAVRRRPVGLVVLAVLGGTVVTLMFCCGGLLGLAAATSVLHSPSTPATHARKVVKPTTSAKPSPTRSATIARKAESPTLAPSPTPTTPSGTAIDSTATTTAGGTTTGTTSGGTTSGGTTAGGAGSGNTAGTGGTVPAGQCGGDYYINSDGNCVHRPVAGPTAPAGATA